MAGWVEDTIVVCVPVTLEYDPARVGRDYLVAEAERGLTHSLQHIAGHYRIEGGKAAEAGFSGVSYEKDDAERRIADMVAEWISVDERLPDHGGTVVCRTKDRRLEFGRVMTVSTYYGKGFSREHHWRGYPDGPLEVTHWFPLPEPPEAF